MVVQDIQQYAEVRPKARAYFCYLFHKNLPNHLPSSTIGPATPPPGKPPRDPNAIAASLWLAPRGTPMTW